MCTQIVTITINSRKIGICSAEKCTKFFRKEEDKVEVFEPLYIFFYLLLVGFIYVPILLYTIFKFKFNLIGWLFIALSAGSYLLLGKYMVDSGYYSDEEPTELLFGLGFLELTLLAYPYIFMVLAVLLGKKEERNS